ncbi:hypothetical protein KUL42_00030 [Alteromonas sp. KUL42]|uniref:hypothetical protein n=1 Tax=Alteromonas sp. KUL42 TaxID=2480797 RepID=UPI0010358105|nr:hypothetical protein [Alteromonas sp. KUL42]TAP38048.1 hypothetical protein EYR97_00020 [Alteromonas sp. KUL42]GEA05242.1 hypothetical protein KUL42_00030 [Alteromonas sp. KUL42]
MSFLRSVLKSGLCLFLAATANTHAHEQHEPGHIASPEQYELLLENERALVLKMVLKPGESDSFHRHNNETVYFEKGSKLKIEALGAEPIVADVPDGHVMSHEAWTHRVTNLGEQTAIAIIVEEK